jgi:DNA-binding LacI/PurR family transcriptional regulator
MMAASLTGALESRWYGRSSVSPRYTPLTVVSHSPTRMGEEAGRLLWRRLDGDDGPPERIVLPTELVPRGSGEIPPSAA